MQYIKKTLDRIEQVTQQRLEPRTAPAMQLEAPPHPGSRNGYHGSQSTIIGVDRPASNLSNTSSTVPIQQYQPNQTHHHQQYYSQAVKTTRIDGSPPIVHSYYTPPPQQPVIISREANGVEGNGYRGGENAYREDNEDDGNYMCCCNSMHVERGAYIIAFVGALLATIFGIINLLAGNVVLFVITIFFFLIYWSILLAQRRHKASYYLPFLFLNGFGAVLLALYIIFLIFMLIIMPGFWVRETYGDGFYGYAPGTQYGMASYRGQLWPTNTPQAYLRDEWYGDLGQGSGMYNRYFWGAVRLFTWLQLFLAAVAEGFTVWFWWVVYRAYRYTRGEEERTAPMGRQNGRPSTKVY